MIELSLNRLSYLIIGNQDLDLDTSSLISIQRFMLKFILKALEILFAIEINILRMAIKGK